MSDRDSSASGGSGKKDFEDCKCDLTVNSICYEHKDSSASETVKPFLKRCGGRYPNVCADCKEDYEWHQPQKPVASKTGKELAPCPFCGMSDVQDSVKSPLLVFCRVCNHHWWKDSWGKAWSHKRIAHLENELENQCFMHSETIEQQEKQIASLTERVKELETEREAARNEIQYLNGICDGEMNQKEKLKFQLDAANKRNEELKGELESSKAGRSLLRRELNDVCLKAADDKRQLGYQVSALTRQLDKQGEALKKISQVHAWNHATSKIVDSEAYEGAWLECVEIAKEALQSTSEMREGKI